MMPSDRPTLAPCPVCGRAPSMIGALRGRVYVVYCTHPGCVKRGPAAPSPTEAAQEWNRAATPNPETRP